MVIDRFDPQIVLQISIFLLLEFQLYLTDFTVYSDVEHGILKHVLILV